MRTNSSVFSLDGRAAGLGIDVGAMVRQAVVRSRSGFFIARAFQELTGTRPAVDVPLELHYSEAAVGRFAGRIASVLNAGPVNASIGYSAAGVTAVSSRMGI